MSYDIVREEGYGEYYHYNLKLVKIDKTNDSNKTEHINKKPIKKQINKKQINKKQINKKNITNKPIRKKSLSYLIQHNKYKIGETGCSENIIFDNYDYNDYNDYKEYDSLDDYNEESYDSETSEDNYYYDYVNMD